MTTKTYYVNLPQLTSNAINILQFENVFAARLDKGGQSACVRQSMVCVQRRAIRNKGICSAWSIRLAYSTSGFKSSWVSLPHYCIYQIALNVQCVYICTSKINKVYMYVNKNLIVFSLLVSHSLRHVG